MPENIRKLPRRWRLASPGFAPAASASENASGKMTPGARRVARKRRRDERRPPERCCTTSPASIDRKRLTSRWPIRAPSPHFTTDRATRKASTIEENGAVGKPGIRLRRREEARSAPRPQRRRPDAVRIGRALATTRHDGAGEGREEPPRLNRQALRRRREPHREDRRRDHGGHGDGSSRAGRSPSRRRLPQPAAQVDRRPWHDIVDVLGDVLPRQRVVAGHAGIPSGAAGDRADDAAAGGDRLASQLAEDAIPARVGPHGAADAERAGRRRRRSLRRAARRRGRSSRARSRPTGARSPAEPPPSVGIACRWPRADQLPAERPPAVAPDSPCWTAARSACAGERRRQSIATDDGGRRIMRGGPVPSSPSDRGPPAICCSVRIFRLADELQDAAAGLHAPRPPARWIGRSRSPG